MLNIKFHSKPVYDEKYIKAKVKTFNSVVNTVFLDYKIPKESIRYICIAEVSIDSVMKIDKKLSSSSSEECKYKIKEKKFIDAE